MRTSDARGRIAAWVVGLVGLGAVLYSDPVITRSWRTALIERTLLNPTGAQWIELMSTSALGDDPYSMIQMDMDKDQATLSNANGLFVDVEGNKNLAAHLNLSSSADDSIALALGIHGPGQVAIGADVDDTNNTSGGIKIAQGGTNGNANQSLVDLAAEEDFLTGTYGGSFAGNFVNATVRDVLKYRVDYAGNMVTAGSILSYSAGGVGYASGLGAGGTITQGAGSGKATGVTLNTASGQITMNNATLNAGVEVSFVVTNSAVAATDVVIANHSSAGTAGAYIVGVSAVGAGSFTVTVSNVSAGNLGEAIVISFAVIKGASS